LKKKIFLTINFILIILLFIIETKYNKEITSFDMSISSYIWSLRTPFLTRLMKLITFLASSKFIIGTLLIYILLKRDYIYPLNLSINAILNHVLKKIFKRPRPSNILVIEKSHSFPSGHSMAAVSFYGYLIYMILKSKINRIYKILLTIVLVIIILLIGFSRIYLGAHYFSDVICGFLISIEYLIIFISISNRVTKK